MTVAPDADLREWFRDLRQHDCAATPAFESVLARAPAPLRAWQRLAWVGAGFALVAVAGLLLILREPPTADVAAVALPAWHSPTDFLLARADDSLSPVPWAPSPTSSLGQPISNRHRERR